MSGTKLKRDHHLWTRDTVKNVSGALTIESQGDLTLDGKGRNVILKDSNVTNACFDFNVNNCSFKMIDPNTAGDYTTFTQGLNGQFTIHTQDADDAGAAHITLKPERDLKLSPTRGDVLVSSSTSLKPSLTLKNTTNDAHPSSLNFVKDKGAVGADNDIVGRLSFTSDNDAQEQIEFARIDISVADASDSNEGGKLELKVASHDGDLQNGLSIFDGDADGEVDVNIGTGTASMTSIAGHLSLPDNGKLYLGTNADNDYITSDGSDILIKKNDITRVQLSDTQLYLNYRATSFTSTATESPTITIESDVDDATSGKLSFVKDRGGNGTAGQDNDEIGIIQFSGRDDSGSGWITYGKMITTISDASDTAEGGKLELQVASHDGEVVTGLKLQDGSLEDEIDVTIASGTSSRTIVSGALTMYGETFTLQNATASHPQMLITNINDDANGGNIHFYKNSTSTADNDSLGTITWEGNNDNLLGETVTPCRIDGQFLDVSDGAEKGRINLDVAEYDGTLTTGLTVFGTATNGQVDVTLGASATSTIGFSGKLQVPEISSPSAPADGAGGYLYTKTDGKPYWISNEVSETDLSASGGGGSSSYHWSLGARARCQYNNWFWACHITYGWNYYYYFYSTGASSLPSTYPDSYAPGFIVPVDSTVTGYNIVGNPSTGDTWEFAIMKGAQPTFGSAGDWTLSQIGSTQSAGGFSLRLYKWEETGLSVAVSKNDMIMPVFRRTTDNDTSLAYNEFSMNVTLSPS